MMTLEITNNRITIEWLRLNIRIVRRVQVFHLICRYMLNLSHSVPLAGRLCINSFHIALLTNDIPGCPSGF